MGEAAEQRDTLLAAQIAARNSGRRVEVTDLRTETTTTYADPAGTVTTESAPAPIRARDASGRGWAPVDLRLEARDGHYKPRSAPGNLTLSIGGNDSLVGVGPQGRRFTLRWPGPLPEPRVEGSTAVYPDVDRGVDLVVEAERSGFEQSFTVKQRQDRQLVYRMPMGAAGMRVEARQGGGFRLLDDKGAVVGEIPRPVMYDAQRDPVTGDPLNVRLLDVRIVNTATGPVMQVMPDRAWLDAPSTRYPVTLDPSVHLGQLQDTWVSSNTSTQTFYTAADLRSGKYGGTGAVQRSLLQFDPGPIRGTNVLSATLALYNNQSASCDQSKVTRAYALAGPFDANTTWFNRPGVDSSIPFTTTTGSKAGPTCTTAGFLGTSWGRRRSGPPALPLTASPSLLRTRQTRRTGSGTPAPTTATTATSRLWPSPTTATRSRPTDCR